jgi:hypothetical protein
VAIYCSVDAVLQKQLFGYGLPLTLSQQLLPGIFMKRNSSPSKWRHYAPDVILLCVRWYCRYSLSYRDLEDWCRRLSKGPREPSCPSKQCLQHNRSCIP